MKQNLNSPIFMSSLQTPVALHLFLPCEIIEVVFLFFLLFFCVWLPQFLYLNILWHQLPMSTGWLVLLPQRWDLFRNKWGQVRSCVLKQQFSKKSFSVAIIFTICFYNVVIYLFATRKWLGNSSVATTSALPWKTASCFASEYRCPNSELLFVCFVFFLTLTS